MALLCFSYVAARVLLAAQMGPHTYKPSHWSTCPTALRSGLERRRVVVRSRARQPGPG